MREIVFKLNQKASGELDWEITLWATEEPIETLVIEHRPNESLGDMLRRAAGTFDEIMRET